MRVLKLTCVEFLRLSTCYQTDLINSDHNSNLSENVFLGTCASRDVVITLFGHCVQLASMPGTLPEGLAETSYKSHGLITKPKTPRSH